MEKNNLFSVSVVIPTYNRQRTIERSVYSVLNQTYTVDQVIIIDDNSTDNTLAILSKIKDPRLILKKLETNSGACVARNCGIDLANGRLIAFQDSDDEWLPTKIEEQVKIIKEKNADIVCSSYLQIYNGKERLIPAYAFDGFLKHENIIGRNMVSTQCILGKAECFKKIRFNNNLLRLQDWNLALDLLSHYNLWFMAKPLVRVYLQEDSISMKPERLLPSLEIIYETHRDLIDGNLAFRKKWLNTLASSKFACHLCPEQEFKESLMISWDKETFLKLLLYKLGLLRFALKARTQIKTKIFS